MEGARLVHLKGYGATGIKEILDAVGVPKGSFYFYFKSKQDFGLQLIDHYSRNILRKLDAFTVRSDLSPMQRLTAFFDWFLSMNEKNQYRGGCPIGNLSQELADIDEVFQKRLHQVFEEMKDRISGLIVEAQSTGEVETSLDPHALGDLVFSTFQGALIQMKASADPSSLLNFRHLLLKGFISRQSKT